MSLVDFSQNLSNAVSLVTANFIGGLASFIVVLIFLAIGYIVARILAGIVSRGLKEMKLEKKLEQHGIHDALGSFSVSEIIVIFIKLATFAVFLGIAADVTGLVFLNQLIDWFLSYLPLLIQGTVILVVALLAVDYVADRIRTSKEIPFANLVALLTKIFVFYTAAVIAIPLILPNADVSILKLFFTLMVGAFAVAIGFGSAIALGLGLKDVVRDVGKKKEKEIQKLLS
jgi:hypothetical protein